MTHLFHIITCGVFWNRRIKESDGSVLFGSFSSDTTKDNSICGISVRTFMRKCPNFVQGNENSRISYKVV